MPGMELTFACACGHRSENVSVGATEDGEYEVFICLECRRILSHWRQPGRRENDPPRKPRKCDRCGHQLMRMTDTGAWGPARLQERFPESEPWMVAGGEWPDDASEEERELVSQIRILCPQCRAYAVDHEAVTLWDE